MKYALPLVYGILIKLFPRRFRAEYGAEMAQLFRDLAADPDVSTADLLGRMAGDLRYALGGMAAGALPGCLIVLIWYVNRSDVIPFDPTVGMVLIATLIAVAGLVGALRSGTILGGVATGFTAGVVSSVTVPGDYLLFGLFPFIDAASFVLTMLSAATVVMLLSTIGASLPLVQHLARARLTLQR